MPSVQQTPTSPAHPAASEHTSLLHWHHAECAEAAQATPTPAQSHSYLSHILPFTRLSTARPAAEEHARHFWNIDRPGTHTAPIYKPGIADAIRLNGITFSSEAIIGIYAMAGFMDEILPNGSTVLNPNGTRNELAAFTCLLGAYVALGSIGPAMAGHLYGSMVFSCNSVAAKLHAHPLTTRMVGYATSMTLATGGLIGALVLERHIHSHSSNVPESPSTPNIYDRAGVLALVAAVPGLAAVGWYLGRVSSAAIRGR